MSFCVGSEVGGGLHLYPKPELYTLKMGFGRVHLPVAEIDLAVGSFQTLWQLAKCRNPKCGPKAFRRPSTEDACFLEIPLEDASAGPWV